MDPTRVLGPEAGEAEENAACFELYLARGGSGQRLRACVSCSL